MSRMSLVVVAVAGLSVVALALGWWARRRVVVVRVEGFSMAPTLRPGDRVVVRRRPVGRVRRGDVVVLEPPEPARSLGPDGPSWNIKRVVALPGDAVPARVYGGEAHPAVPAGHLVVFGDNPDSVDSRHYGFFPADRLLGVAVRLLGGGRLDPRVEGRQGGGSGSEPVLSPP
ncbi:signal peptidase I [Longispora sp. K20-0274]|uniref:signal peptidase I n=1 Tax=Longispora sp. K20-0274 TaxID=3088255 RepID=UPI00399C47A4